MVTMKHIAPMVCALALSACATPRDTTGSETPDRPYLAPNFGRVVKVNDAAGYVILECAVLPNEGERITLIRGNKGAGIVRVSRIMSGRHAAADIEEGFPMEGDRFRIDQRRAFNNETRP